MSAIYSSSSGTTITVTQPCDGDFPSDAPCRWEEMHHYDDEGNHYCPTGFMWCVEHLGGNGTISGPGACHLWGTKPSADGGGT